jgi:hypothetical protein
LRFERQKFQHILSIVLGGQSKGRRGGRASPWGWGVVLKRLGCRVRVWRGGGGLSWSWWAVEILILKFCIIDDWECWTGNKGVMV